MAQTAMSGLTVADRKHAAASCHQHTAWTRAYGTDAVEPDGTNGRLYATVNLRSNDHGIRSQLLGQCR